VARILLAAAHKSSGKTVITTGLAAALCSKDRHVQCFKKGPDYIDPMWLSAASGRPCYNLDFNTMADSELLELFCSRTAGARLSLIEANKGLYDGVKLDGCDSNAQLAKLLKLPVILVIDTVGMTRGIAPLLLGYREFDRDINLAGVILNNVGGARHEGKLRAAVEAYSDIPVIGSVWRTSTLTIGERHLGLITPGEAAGPSAVIAGFGEVIKGSVDIDRVVKIAQSAPQLKPAKKATLPASAKGLRIGIARDAAFGFYYSDDLEYFDRIGVELVPINMLEEGHLPDIDGLFIGGGFPETHLEELAKNQAMLKSVKTAIVAGLPTYAECGGLMYLCRSLDWNGLSRNLASVIPANAIMCTKPQGRGYTVFSPTPDHPWYAQGQSIPGHEFHYARLDNLPADISYGCKVARGAGIDGHHDGIVAYNLLASFCHLRNTAANPWIERFVDFVQTCKRGRPSHSSGAS